MNWIRRDYDFPLQRVSEKEKEKPEWYANCCDWIIDQGLANKDLDSLYKKYNIVNGNIPDEFYKKILNPYNSTKEEYTRFPATMRNYDLIKGIIRRYVSEYIKNPHKFIVGANNPEIMLAKNAKLKQELSKIVQVKISERIQQIYAQYINQGNDPNTFNPQEHIDVEGFIKEFNSNYVDDISKQGQELLNVILDITEDELLYSEAYFNWVTYGECYTYTDVIDNKLIKRNIIPIDAYPINTDNIFREDDDMFACRRRLSYQQIIDEFDEYLTESQRKFLESYYGRMDISTPIPLTFKDYNNSEVDICNKFSKTERELFNNKNNILNRDNNSDLIDVWHVVWRGERRMAIVTFINEAGLLDTRVELDNYKLNTKAGDISIEYEYEPQVYEAIRIGARTDGIYPYKARAIAYNRNGKLPYNGINEIFPGFGKFSIAEIVAPFQVFYNIVAYHREMAIAKNKLFILLIAKSLLGENPEDTIYKMVADGVLYIDDESDDNMLKSQQVRMLNASMGDYITQLSNLLIEIEQSAKNQVDMTPQRYGEIANSAGKAVTEEAVIRGSMGSVIIEYLMDCMRERDYARDLDYSKLAWIDGLNRSYKGEDNKLKYISLDVNSHIYADYIIKAKNSSKENEKLQQLKQFAFNASQNGDVNMALAAITGDNVASVAKLIKEFQSIKDQHETELKQIEQQTKQMEQQFEMQKIQVKGEEDRKSIQLKGYIDSQIELIRADANLLSYNAEIGDAKQDSLNRLDEAKNDIEKTKLSLEQQKILIDSQNKREELRLKEKDIDTKLKIAKENKNKYDKSKK